MTGKDADQKIGEVLSQLEVPEHKDGFMDSLAKQIKHEQKTAHSSKKQLRILAFVTPAVAAAAAVAFIVGGLGSSNNNNDAQLTSTTVGGEEPLDNPLLASEVVALAQDAIVELKGVSLRARVATYYNNTAQGGELFQADYEFRQDNKGNYWLKDAFDNVNGSQEEGYDVNSYTSTQFLDGIKKGDGAVCVTTGEAPSNRNPLSLVFNSTYGVDIALRSISNSDSATLEEVTHNGRPAWKVSTTVPKGDVFFRPDFISVVVDKESRFPVKMDGTLDGKPFVTVDVYELNLNPTFVADSFKVQIPPGVPVTNIDGGNKQVALSEVEAAVGYKPVVPAIVPDGYELTNVSVATRGLVSGPEGSNPASDDVVTLTYRYGLKVMEVTTRSAGADPSLWNDPYGYEGEPSTQVTKRTLSEGAFARLNAQIVDKSTTQPHLWGVGEKLVLTVSADVSADDLVKIANSLRS